MVQVRKPRGPPSITPFRFSSSYQNHCDSPRCNSALPAMKTIRVRSDAAITGSTHKLVMAICTSA